MNYSFHDKYIKISPWWRIVSQTFKLTESHVERGPVRGFEFEDWQVKLCKNGFITIKEGFVWGASFLTIDTKSSRRASLVHDAYFYLSDQGVFKGPRSKNILDIVNLYMHEMLLQDGMYEFRANAWFRALDTGAHIAWESENDND